MRVTVRWLWATAFLCLAASAASAVTVDWVFIGSPNNACSPTPPTGGCYGAVSTYYQIAKYDVTNAQYTEFLNAVADADPNELYHVSMANSGPGNYGGITRSCPTSVTCTYSVISGRGNMPVNFVSFHDAMRFANWLQNGQPTGTQGAGTTETGTYTITPDGITNNSITRNEGATFWIPNEDEWFKAAYYNPSAESYYDFPFGSSSVPNCTTPPAAANSANCNNAVSDLTDVGSYTNSASPYGTFDQGGNLYQWNETITLMFSSGARGIRGGTLDGSVVLLEDTHRQEAPAGQDDPHIGFRVAPEPTNDMLLVAGILALACCRKRRIV